jgi:flagellar export protein FliJ
MTVPPAKKQPNVWKRWQEWCNGVKAFHFRLDPALRWRATQLRLEQERVSQTAAQIAAIQTEVNGKYAELRSGASELIASGSAAFESWAAYVDRCRRRIRTLNAQLPEARKALAQQTLKMVEAHQRLKVLENLKKQGHAQWTNELNRETDAFAGEAFLAGLLTANARAATAEKRAGEKNPQTMDRADTRARIEGRTGA